MLRLGIVDFDSSHCVEFTRRFNHVGVDSEQMVEGARVVYGCPGKSAMSPERVPGFTETMRQCGVQIVEQPADMLGRIDAVLVLSVSGIPHRERAMPFLETGIPAFVDKPFACSLEDAEAMIDVTRTRGVLLWSSSALRFSEENLAFQAARDRTGDILGAVTYGPGTRADGNPGLFHYGIHCVELLFSVMGSGCASVRSMAGDASEQVTGQWNDGRIGTVRASQRGHSGYGLLAFCEQGVIHVPVSTRFAYRNLCREIVKTFQTGEPPVSHAGMLESVRFVLAASASEQHGGADVPLAGPFPD